MLWFGISFHWVFAFGTLCALVGLAGKMWTSAALGAYLAYLSIVGIGQTFTAYQWDMFLIECLFAAAILRIVSYRYEFARSNGISALGEDTGRCWTRSDRRIWLPQMARRVPRVTHEPLELP